LTRSAATIADCLAGLTVQGPQALAEAGVQLQREGCMQRTTCTLYAWVAAQASQPKPATFSMSFLASCRHSQSGVQVRGAAWQHSQRLSAGVRQ
jgi:hypothetical protein